MTFEELKKEHDEIKSKLQVCIKRALQYLAKNKQVYVDVSNVKLLQEDSTNSKMYLSFVLQPVKEKATAISFGGYIFKDENGIIHLTDTGALECGGVADDPRIKAMSWEDQNTLALAMICYSYHYHLGWK